MLRTIQILRGLSVGMGISYSCAEEWRELAMEALSTSRDNDQMIHKGGYLKCATSDAFRFIKFNPSIVKLLVNIYRGI
mgnify:CR=1 FL=1